MQKNVLIFGSLSILSFSAGAVAGYLYAKTKLEGFFEEQVDAEVRAAIAIHDEEIGKRRESSEETETEMARDAVEALKDYQGVPATQRETTRREYHKIKKTEESTEVVEEAPESPPAEVDFEYEKTKEEEVATRDKTRPYIIALDEYMQNDSGYAQISLTYYEGDDTLTESGTDDVLDPKEAFIGEDNLRFGYLSKEPHIVYIRNSKLECDYEVARSTGKYIVEVLGEPG